MDGLVSHRLCFEKQMRTSGGRYGGEKVVAGGKIAAMAANAAAGTGAVTKPAVEQSKSEETKAVEVAAEAPKVVTEAPKAEVAKVEAEAPKEVAAAEEPSVDTPPLVEVPEGPAEASAEAAVE